MFKFDDTICAPATVPGTGAITVIRVSGSDALEIVDKVVCFASGNASESNGYTIKFGQVKLSSGEILDEVLVSVFKAPHSYTGENSAEISCHASAYIAAEILALLVQAGARMALPGEFTQRAFVNGKMDLAQAEAVADVIASSSEALHRLAFNQLKGGFSSELKDIRARLLEITSLLELELDFSEEDVEFADRSHLRELVEQASAHTMALAGSFKVGNAVKNGIPVAICGAANTGKSTLLNAVLGDERAIVTDIEGTTRDTIEETRVIGGLLFRFIDTAGIRETDEVVEKIGIERSMQAISKADIVLVMLDPTRSMEKNIEDLEAVISRVDSAAQDLVILVNKCDFIENSGLNNNVIDVNNFVLSIENKLVARFGASYPYKVIKIAAKTGFGLDEVENYLVEKTKIRIRKSSSGSETMVTNMRHFEALSSASTSLSRVLEGLSLGIPSDLVAQDLREAIYHLGSITGEISTDEVLGNIFRNFCIGK